MRLMSEEIEVIHFNFQVGDEESIPKGNFSVWQVDWQVQYAFHPKDANFHF